MPMSPVHLLMFCWRSTRCILRCKHQVWRFLLPADVWLACLCSLWPVPLSCLKEPGNIGFGRKRARESTGNQRILEPSEGSHSGGSQLLVRIHWYCVSFTSSNPSNTALLPRHCCIFSGYSFLFLLGKQSVLPLKVHLPWNDPLRMCCTFDYVI